MNDPGQTLEAVEGMTPVMKTKEKAEAEDGQTKEEKKAEIGLQLTQLEATFNLKKVPNSLSINISSFLLRLIYISMKQPWTTMSIKPFFVLHWKPSLRKRLSKHSICNSMHRYLI